MESFRAENGGPLPSISLIKSKLLSLSQSRSLSPVFYSIFFLCMGEKKDAS